MNSPIAPTSQHRTFYLTVMTVLLALIPISTVTPLPKLKALAPVLLLFWGIGCLIFSPRARRAFLGAWPVWIPAGFMLAWIIVNFNLYHLGWPYLDRPFHILLYALIAATFAALATLRYLWCGLSLSGSVLGIYCIWQYFGVHLHRVHAPGYPPTSAIVFAIILFALALCSLLQLWHAKLDRKWLKTIHMIGFILAAYGGLLTGSRGPLLSFICTIALLIFIYLRQRGHWRKVWPWIVVALLIGAGAVASTGGAVIHHFEPVKKQITDFHHGTVTGSAGKRLEMWRVAWHGFRENPWTGVGAEGYQHYALSEIKAGRASSKIGHYSSPHNVYLNFAIQGGIPALLILLATFFVPISFFRQHLRQANPDTEIAAQAGLAITVLWLLAGITENIFRWTLSVSCFYFFVFGLAVFIASRHKTIVSDVI